VPRDYGWEGGGYGGEGIKEGRLLPGPGPGPDPDPELVAEIHQGLGKFRYGLVHSRKVLKALK
jgi:hypothetical protein